MLLSIPDEIRYYVTPGGYAPFAAWFEDLDLVARAKVTRAVARMGRGNFSNVKSVGRGVLELRIDFGPGYRVYFGREGETLGDSADRRDEEAPTTRYRYGALLLAGLQAGRTQPTLSGDGEMTRTRSFSDLVQKNVRADKKFAEALLREGVDALISGDVESGKTLLRDYIKATVGFEKLGAATGAPPKSLIRMFGPRGNPQAKNLFSVIGYLQKRAGVRLHVAG
jgi:putative addiction module killer protein